MVRNKLCDAESSVEQRKKKPQILWMSSIPLLRIQTFGDKLPVQKEESSQIERVDGWTRLNPSNPTLFIDDSALCPPGVESTKRVLLATIRLT